MGSTPERNQLISDVYNYHPSDRLRWDLQFKMGSKPLVTNCSTIYSSVDTHIPIYVYAVNFVRLSRFYFILISTEKAKLSLFQTKE